jgi:hypothetical protein
MPVFDLVEEAAIECLQAADGTNFENKIVLSIAVRLVAEKHMINAIQNPTFVDAIKTNQTAQLLREYKRLFSSNKIEEIKVLERVALMTPENIHLNSFMYEPILDMSDEHLRKLYVDISALK